MKKALFFLFFILIGLKVEAQKSEVSGKVLDAETGKPLSGATVSIKNKNIATLTDAEGSFKLQVQAPVNLLVSMVGYVKYPLTVTGAESLAIFLVSDVEMLNQVVVSASRIEESILKSPVTIEKMDIRAIQQTPSANFYDALVNVKGLDMVTSSLTYKSINTRGFNTTGNGRFLQTVDGMDSQSAGLGFAMGNLFGPHDIDVESVELIPGAASALYGPVAFNGLLSTRTKNAFDYQGLSVQTKVGVNHIADGTGLGAKLMGDFALRYARAFNNKFAFKINLSHLGGTDWYANDLTDIDANTAVSSRGPNNPGKNQLNIYGDEVAQTIEGIGRVSRTGYEERFLANYDVRSTKAGGTLNYKIKGNLEAIYQLNYNQGVAQYTGSQRFGINGFTLIQQRLELKDDNFYVRAYSSQEDSKSSYQIRSLGQLINKTWVKDLNGNVVPANQADATWFQRYTAAFTGKIPGVAANADATARAFADEGRLLPGTAAFDSAKEKLIETQGLSGAGIFSKCGLKHFEGMYDFSSLLKVVNFQVGGNLRKYYLNTQGTLFDDKDKNLTNSEYGIFAQASKSVLNQKLKFTVSGRYDKNENFDGRFTPRASIVFSPKEKHNFRASYQTGFRNPTIGDQYIKLNAGPIIILGGAPVNSKDTKENNAYANSYTIASVSAFGGAFGKEVASGVPFPQAVSNNKDKLVKSNVAYIKPEQVKSFEIGYKGILNDILTLDLNYYNSQYKDFLINTVVMAPNSDVLGADGKPNFNAAADILGGKTQLYQLYTNASDKVSIQGVGLGLGVILPKSYRLNGNLTWSDFNIMDANPNNIPAFNTPKWKTNLIFSNSKVKENLGFSVAWHWQSAFDWYGTFTTPLPGRIKAYSLLDAQVSYKLPALKTIVKLGGSNITNQYIVQAYGSPAVGGLYYLSLNFDEFLR
ncbi:MAG: TonB-dependent receptor [Bacteroidetes bacterium]|nr:TonB-dependent receptor [Bacteroidota bacterium]